MQDVQAIRDDLAFMRAMAEEGRRTPLMIGPSLFVGGLIYGFTSLFDYALATHLLAAPAWLAGGVWFIATLVYLPYIIWRSRTARCSRAGVAATNNRAAAAAWQGVGFALLTMLVACAAIAGVVKTNVVFAVFPSLVMAVYGAGWTVAAAMSSLRWIRWVAGLSFATAVLMGFAVANPALYAVYALALFGLLALPGWLLMQGETQARA